MITCRYNRFKFNGIMFAFTIAQTQINRGKGVHIDYDLLNTPPACGGELHSLGISGSPYLYKRWLTFLADTKMSNPNDKVNQMEAIKSQIKPNRLLQHTEMYEEFCTNHKNKIFIVIIRLFCVSYPIRFCGLRVLRKSSN